MRIPLWIWLIIGLSVLSWIIPDGIPGEEFLLPAIAVISILLRMRRWKFYQNQYRQYQQHAQSGAGSSQAGSTGSSQSSSSFYSRFKNWNAGFQQPQNTVPGKDPCDILEVKRGASMDEIKKAYRAKLKKFHPDTVANLKLDSEYKQMFEEKTREIQKAYEQLGGK